MHFASCQPPDKKAVYGSETQFACSRAVACPPDVIKDPGQFCGGKIGVEQKAGLFHHFGFLAGVFHHRADVCSAPILPDDGIMDRLAGGAVPDDCGFALVCDADGHRHAAAQPCLCYHGGRYIDGCLPDILGVVLDPAVGREMLRKLGGLLRQYGTFLVKKDGARTSGSLVDGDDGAKVAHGPAFSFCIGV